MKRVISIMMMFFVLKACKKNDDSKMTIQEGRILVETNDCKTCHHPTNKIIGPAHLDVAKKYETTEENIQMLANRIIQGGSGVYGEIPMTAHTDLSLEDARKMSLYILSLDE